MTKSKLLKYGKAMHAAIYDVEQARPESNQALREILDKIPDLTQKSILIHGEAMYEALRKAMLAHGRKPATGAYRIARDLLEKMHVRHPERQPVRAFSVEIDGCAKTYIPARSSELAKWSVVKLTSVTERKGLWALVRVSRAKEYDAWAKTAEPRLHVVDEVLEGVCQQASSRISNSSASTAAPTSSGSPTAAPAFA